MSRTQQQQIKQPIKVQRWGGAFQVENISDPSVKQELFGWMAAHEYGPQSSWRFATPLDSRKLSVLKSGKLYASKRPGPARSGYLCFYPKMKVAVFVEDADRRPNQEKQQTPRTAVLRMRHSPSIYNNGGSIFAATLAVSDSTLWLEDVLVYEGVNQWKNDPFTSRWETLKKWYQHDWSEDQALQRGLAIKPRQIVSLDAFKSEPGEIWEFLPEEADRRRFVWKDKRLNTVVLSSYPQKPKPERVHTGKTQTQQQAPVQQKVSEPTKKGILDTYFPSLPVANDGSLYAIAKKDSTGGPDVFGLYSSDGTYLGIAVIRKMQISLQIRKYNDKVTVKVEWNSSVDRWEITEVDIGVAPCPASAFVK